MAQQQQNITVSAPGFLGLNTQLSPTEQPAPYASVADNCVIDQYGRVAARKGFQLTTDNAGATLGNVEPVVQVGEFVGHDGATVTFCAGDEKLFRSTGTSLVELTLPHVPTGNDWVLVPFNNRMYFLQNGDQPLYYNHDTGSDTLISVANPSAGPTDATDLSKASVALAAHGRLWLAGFTDEGSVISWSALLDGTDWETANGAGSISMELVWPAGSDSVTALAAYNNFLIVFGQRSIVVYLIPLGGSGVTNVGPDYMTLQDTVSGIGCVARDSVATVGTDLIFLESSGLRSFQRTIQEKSMPLGDISQPIKVDLKDALMVEGLPNSTSIKSFYDQHDAVYYLFLPGSSLIYAFDLRFTQAGTGEGARITSWPITTMQCGCIRASGESLFGAVGGLFEYDGFVDQLPDGAGIGGTTNSPIRWKYHTHPLDFDDASRLKIPRQVDSTIIGDVNAPVQLRWSFDYDSVVYNRHLTVDGVLPSEYNIAEFGDNGDPLAEYTKNAVPISQVRWNVWGSGRNIRLGWEAALETGDIALQEFNLQTLLGRIL